LGTWHVSLQWNAIRAGEMQPKFSFNDVRRGPIDYVDFIKPKIYWSKTEKVFLPTVVF
jgi:hypothetical protein